MDNNKKTDIVVASTDGYIYAWELNTALGTTNKGWPELHYDNRNTGCYNCDKQQCNTDADKTPYGNCDGVLNCTELNNYIQGYYLNSENIGNVSDAISKYLASPVCS